jgi:hypothetical protein
MFDHLFLLHSKDERGAVELGSRTDLFEVFRKIVRGEYKHPSPVVLQRKKGTKYYDLLEAGYVGMYVISDRMKQLLEKEKIAGWSTYDVEVYGSMNERIDGYHGLAVSGRCGPLDNSKCERVTKQRDNGVAYQTWLGFYFDIDTWDKSDIFVPDGTIFKVVTEKFRSLVISNKLTNVSFDRLTEVERISL